jgi:hypothetical protein
MDRTRQGSREPAGDTGEGSEEWRRWVPGQLDTEEGTFPDRFWLLVTGLLVVTLPALTLTVAYVALTATRSVAVGQLTATEAVELYLIEVVAFAAFSYLLYRLTLYTVRRQGASEQADGE